MPEPLLDHPLLAQRWFFPRPDRFPAPLRIPVEGAVLACSRHRAGGERLTVVHFHGNGEVVGDWREGLPGWLAAQGCALLLVEYRGYGMSTGEPRLGAMLDDVAAVVRGAALDPRRVVFFGRSVGSLFALEGVARFPEAAGLVVESGIADVLERLLLRVRPEELAAAPAELEAAVARRLDQRAKMAGYRGPALILHAEHDGLVEVSHGERLASWAGGPATLRRFARGDHNSILAENQEEYLEALRVFLAGLGAAAGPVAP
jgi:pimeloyl-ACP methyl ester carboxylesterase